MLGSICFIDYTMLPKGYLNSRCKGYEGDEHNWHIMKITDDEENIFYAMGYSKPEIVPAR